jgi:TonB family protein
MLLGVGVSMTLAMAVAGQSAVAEAASKPEPIAPQSWISDDDYPPKAMARGAGGTIGFLLLVDAGGKVTDCRIHETSGFVELDQNTCAILLKRSKFKPARNAAGAAVESVYTGHFTWRQFGDSDKAVKAMKPEPFGIELSLQKLPRGYERPALLRVHFDAAGKPDSCRPEIGSGNATLDKVACEQAITQAVRSDPRRDGLRPDTRMVQVSFEAPKTH